MNQKEQNKKLSQLKEKYARLMEQMIEIENEGLKTLGHDPANDIAWAVLSDYFSGFTSQKEIRPKIKILTETALLHQKN